MLPTFKIQKVLADQGLGSRRVIETWLERGRIKVNGKLAKLGDRINLTAKITVDDKPVILNTAQKPKTQVILYHKPIGEVCTRRDEKGRKTAFNALPKLSQGRWIMVGRLDINTSGLLLFTNDGKLANQLMHPATEIERCYACRVLGKVTPEIIKNLTQGVELDDGPARFKDVRHTSGTGSNQWFNTILTEGRNREVRRLWEHQGLQVNRLIRIAFGPIRLPRNLRPGQWIALTETQLNKLKK